MSLIEVLEKTFINDSFTDLSIEKRLTVLVPRADSRAYQHAHNILNNVYSVNSAKFPKQVSSRSNFRNELAHCAIQLALDAEQSKAFSYLCPDAKPISKDYSLFAPATDPRIRMTESLALIFAFYHRSVDQISLDICRFAKVYLDE